MLLGNVKYKHGGRFTSRSEWIHPRRSIDTFELIVVVEGCVYIEEDVPHVLTPGTVILLEPGKTHEGYQSSPDKVVFYWIHFESDCTETYDGLEKSLCLRDPYAVTLLCRQLLSYAEAADGEYDRSVLDALLHVLICELDKQGREAKNDLNSLACRIHEWIRINADQAITVESVSKHFGYNVDYLSRLFRKHFGHGLKAEIDEMKLREMKKLLLDTDLTLCEVAQKTGIGDYKLFLKFFKYHEGITPSDFRRIYRVMHTNNR